MIKHRLPKLFAFIIEHDNSFPTDGNVIHLDKFFEWKKQKTDLMRSADRFVQKQKGGQ